MIPRFAALLVFTAACGPTSFLSPCGTTVLVGDSREYAAAEGRLISAVSEFTPDVDPVLLCKRVSHWTVGVNPDSDGEGWSTPGRSYRVAGLTYCAYRRIDVANTDWKTNALVHELLHAYDFCETPEHGGWEESGRNKAISKSKVFPGQTCP